jgi:hypothetical protein
VGGAPQHDQVVPPRLRLFHSVQRTWRSRRRSLLASLPLARRSLSRASLTARSASIRWSDVGPSRGQPEVRF